MGVIIHAFIIVCMLEKGKKYFASTCGNIIFTRQNIFKMENRLLNQLRENLETLETRAEDLKRQLQSRKLGMTIGLVLALACVIAMMVAPGDGTNSYRFFEFVGLIIGLIMWFQSSKGSNKKDSELTSLISEIARNKVEIVKAENPEKK